MDASEDGVVPARRLVGRDPAATAEKVFRKHHRDITRYISSRFHADIADDVASAVYIKILEGRYPEPGMPTWPWLRVVATNAAIDLLRASKSDRHEALTLDLAAPSDAEGQLTSRIDIECALKDLRRVERDAVLALPSGYRPSDVADHHGRTVSAIHSITKRTKARLRVMLEVTAGAAALLGARLRHWFDLGPPPGAEALLHAAAIVALVMVPSVSITQAGHPVPRQQSPSVSHSLPSAPVAASVGHTFSPSGASAPQPNPVRTPLPGLTVEQKADAPTPRKIVVQEPTIDTPVGAVGGGRTEAECDSPGPSLMQTATGPAGHC